MANEIERKFLIDSPAGNYEDYPHKNIIQGYLVIADDVEVRLRNIDGRFYQTVKSGRGLIRQEHEIELTPEQFETLWPMTEGKRVEKTRYDVDYRNKLIELDIYSGVLEGLVVAEVEFSSEPESAEFIPPAWFGDEITHDERYKNKNLALHGIPNKS